MARYEVVESKVWVRDDGARASMYGACPWTREEDRARWTLTSQGWTTADTKYGTVGNGRVPWKTREEAQAFADAWNREHEERHAAWVASCKEAPVTIRASAKGGVA